MAIGIYYDDSSVIILTVFVVKNQARGARPRDEGEDEAECVFCA